MCFINGNRDPVSGKHVIDGLRALRSDVDVYDLPEIGHYPQVEAPADVLRAYAAFRARSAGACGISLDVAAGAVTFVSK